MPADVTHLRFVTGSAQQQLDLLAREAAPLGDPVHEQAVEGRHLPLDRGAFLGGGLGRRLGSGVGGRCFCGGLGRWLRRHRGADRGRQPRGEQREHAEAHGKAAEGKAAAWEKRYQEHHGNHGHVLKDENSQGGPAVQAVKLLPFLDYAQDYGGAAKRDQEPQ